jgi:hypothetical protein
VSGDSRTRQPVKFELREQIPLEKYAWEKEKARDRLILSDGEDKFVILPGGAAPRKQAPAKKVKRAMLASNDTA